MTDLLLFCRHASRDDHEALRSALTDPSAEPDEFLAVAETLRETLAQEQVQLTTIHHARSPLAANYAKRLKEKLVGGHEPPGFAIKVDCRLEPAQFMKWRETHAADRLVKKLVDLVKDPRTADRGSDSAALVVGHMPQLRWLAARLMGNRPLWARLTDGYLTPLALKNGEIAAIALTGERNGRPRGHLEWTVAPDDTQAIEDLRNKIKSKMEIAKLLGGFMTLVLGGVVLAPGRLDELSRDGDRWAVYVAAISFLIAIGLYLRTMYAYDSLLMPKRFWGDVTPGSRPPRWLVRRPPSGAAWVLYQNMLHVWTFLFTPATLAVGVGLVVLAYAALDPGWLEGLISLLVLLLLTAYALWRRPVLGSQD